MEERELQRYISGRPRGLPLQPLPMVTGEAVTAPAAGPPLDIPALIRKYLVAAILLTILGTACGFVAVAFLPPKYRAKTALEVQPVSSSVLKLSGADNDGDLNLLTEARVILSNTFLRAVVQRIELDNAPPPPVRTDIFSRMRRYLRIRDQDDVPVQILKDGLEAERVPKPLAMALTSVDAQLIDHTRIIEITCESSSPELASNFLNALADEYVHQNLQARLQTVQVTTQWLNQQLEEAKNKMLDADHKLEDFVRKSGNVFVSQDQENTLADSQLRELQERLSLAQADLIQRQTRYQVITNTPPESLPDVLDDPAIRSYQSKINDWRREEALLTTTLTPEHPKVKKVEMEIADARAALKKEIDGAVKRITSEYEIAKRNRDSLNAAYNSAASKVSGQAGQAAEYGALKRESESARQMYNSLLLQVNQANLMGSLPVNNIRITDRSIPPLTPYKPKPIMIISLGAFAGLGLCGGIAFLREMLDRRVTSPAHARHLLKLPELGVIPSLEQQRGNRGLLPLLGRAFKDDQVPTEVGNSASPRLDVAYQSLLAESFRNTLASLMRESVHLQKPQVILVTSPGPEEGKTTIASNLGIALAETGRKVLVLDADFRRPRAHKVLGVPNQRGLVDLLEQEAAPIGDKCTFGVQTSVPNLFLMPNGRRPENISKILYSPQLRALMKTLRTAFDTILIDAPPMQVADARILSELADALVLVLRSGVTEKSSAMQTLEQLRSDGILVLGTILNDWKPNKAEAKKRYYYSSLENGDRA